MDLTDNVYDFQEFSKYLLSIFNKGFQLLFSVIIPIGFTSYYPSLIYLRFSSTNLILSLLTIPVSILFFVVSWKIWHIALRHYSSSGQ